MVSMYTHSFAFATTHPHRESQGRNGECSTDGVLKRSSLEVKIITELCNNTCKESVGGMIRIRGCGTQSLINANRWYSFFDGCY